MRVSGITNNGDWTFGRGKANYKQGSSAIRQKVVTRLRSFTNDWFLDTTAGNPWIQAFGSLNNEGVVTRNIEKSILTTDGVRSVDSLNVTTDEVSRKATFRITYTDIFDNQFLLNETIAL